LQQTWHQTPQICKSVTSRNEDKNGDVETSVTRIYVDPAQKIAPLDRKIFGSFVEHLGRSVYGGIYEPGSKLSDPATGFRKDVVEEMRKLHVPIIRYPGGNFVSGYNWLDGIGPKDKRPTVLDMAWNTIEPNQFGTNEFIQWCRAVNAEPLLRLNLGTGTAEMAAALVEYCNQEKGTKWSELRRQHGIERAHNIKWWCLGNEMDGGWQIGHMPAREYGLKARDCANQIRMVDSSVQLVACGSSSPLMATYLEWDREMLEECYDQVDGISLHCYYRNDAQETGARGDVLDLAVDSPTYDVEGIAPVPYIDASASIDKGGPVSLFILNRDLNKPRDVEVVWREGAPQRVLFSQVLTGTDLKASNSFEKPKNVTPRAFEPGKTGAAKTVLQVPARSYTVIQWGSLA
jgi:alpha-L-arabinofuranosidase